MKKRNDRKNLDIELKPCVGCNPEKCWNSELCEELDLARKVQVMDRFERDSRKAQKQRPLPADAR